MENKDNIEEWFEDFKGRLPITEKVAIYNLFAKKINANNLKKHVSIQGDCPFNKSGNHIVDLVLSRKDNSNDSIYIEVKGQMTYHEVNILRFLLEDRTQKRPEENFYILNLTDNNWIEETDNQPKSQLVKSKFVFETQINELVAFYNGDIPSEDLKQNSIDRLNRFIRRMEEELQQWKEKSR